MKFLLVPLLIVGMFVSFTAALLAMLFWDGTVKNLGELKELIMGEMDSTRLPEEFHLKEDKLDTLYRQITGYQRLYEEELRKVSERADSLMIEGTKLGIREDSLIAVGMQLGITQDSVLQQRREENMANSAKYYNAMKPALAAEILQQDGELSDTLVAGIINRLPAAKAGKIMGFMTPEFAARITKIMQGL